MENNDITKRKSADKTKDEIIEAFCLLCSVKSIDKITVNDIVDKAGYSRSTFYCHFNNITELRLFVGDRAFVNLPMSDGDFIRCFTSGNVPLMASTIVKISKEAGSERAALWLQDKKQDVDLFTQTSRRLFQKSFPKASGSNKAKLNFLIEYQIKAYSSILSMWHNNNSGVSLEEIAEVISRANIYGPITIMHELNQ